ncbi:MAG: GTP pyrophosphokinase [Planctomycetota bacterium]|nr:GTP pyrophosphokinase [Planctomycetota bacterium]
MSSSSASSSEPTASAELDAASQIEQAIKIAVGAHSGQRDKAGAAYILHVLRVMLALDDPIAMQAAALHDVVEDTPTTVEDLLLGGVDPRACEAVRLLTHDSQDSHPVLYAEYVIRISADPIAKAVKLSDLHDNYRLDRVAMRSLHQAADLLRIQKYILSYQYLSDQIAADEYRLRMSLLA